MATTKKNPAQTQPAPAVNLGFGGAPPSGLRSANRWGRVGGAPNGPGAQFPGNPQMQGNRPMSWGMGARPGPLQGQPVTYNMNRFNPAYSGFGSLPVMTPQANIGRPPPATPPSFQWAQLDRSQFGNPQKNSGGLIGDGGDPMPAYGTPEYWQWRMRNGDNGAMY